MATTRKLRVTALPGDGIGPEVTREALRVLHAMAEQHGIEADVREHAIGGSAVDQTGSPFPADTQAACLKSDAVLLGAVFVALGYLVSALVRDRGTAGGIAIGIWLFFVLVYDMALLGLLVANQGHCIGGAVLHWLLLANPTDAFRLFNLAGTPGVANFSGLSGLAAQVQLRPAVFAGALMLWVLVPLAGTVAVFSRRQV